MAEEADIVIAWGHGPVPDAAKSAFQRPTKFLTLPNPDKWSEAVAPYGGVQGILAKFAPGVTPLRVACLGFSASCQGVAQLLAGPDAANFDAAVAIDGLHVGYSDKDKHVVNAAGMQPWVQYAGRALNNLCLFIDTHSSIVPPGYASTTETANYLWQKVTSNTDDFVEDPALPSLVASPTSVHVSAGPATGPDRTVQYPEPPWNQKRRARGLIVLGCENLDVPRGTADHIYQAKVILPLVLRQLLARRWNEIDPKQAGATCFLGRSHSSVRWLAEPPKCAKSVILPANFMTREATNKAATSVAPYVLGGVIVAGVAALALLPRAALAENQQRVTVHDVLAGAYAGRGRRGSARQIERVMLSHAAIVDEEGNWVEEKTVCRRLVLQDSVCDALAGPQGTPPTCPVCLERVQKRGYVY